MPWSNTVNNFKNSVPAPRNCFIVGATGEVGKCLLQQVLSSNAFDKVVVITRRSVAYTGPNKDIIEEHIVEDFDELETQWGDVMKGCQFGFCSLGTTRSKAGSPEAFRRVDHDYILSVGRMAKTGGCRWFGLVSAAGANATSSFLYARTKGQTEADMIALDLPQLAIFRPGLLLCSRAESRPLERVAGWFAPLMNFLSGGRAAIATSTVARAMLLDAMETATAAKRGEPSVAVKILDNKAMVNLIKLADKL